MRIKKPLIKLNTVHGPFKIIKISVNGFGNGRQEYNCYCYYQVVCLNFYGKIVKRYPKSNSISGARNLLIIKLLELEGIN